MQIPVHEANLELGVIGNGSFGALVDARGRVVWSCLPAFDGDPAFCALLSPRDHDGGDFGIELEDFAHAEQAYVPNTAVLRTVLHDSRGGSLEILDFAPRWKQNSRIYRPVSIVRRIAPLSGSPRIRIRDLLTHSAGFVDDNPWGDRQTPLPHDQFTRMLEQGVPFSTAPGTAYEYSNFGYALLGRIVANVSAMPYRRYVERTILQPLGMASSGYEVGEWPLDRRAIGYRWEDGRWKEEPTMADGAFGAMGGLQTSANDYARWVAFLLSAWPARDDADTGPVSRASVRMLAEGSNHMAPAQRNGKSGPSACRQAAAYGFAMRVAQDCDLGLTLAHGGGYPGYGSHVMLMPDYGVGIFVFTNRTYNGGAGAAWDAAVALKQAGALIARARPVSALLADGYGAAGRIYAAGDVGAAPASLAMNFLMDADAAHWRGKLAALRGEVGACDTSAPVTATGALSGRFTWTCEKGRLSGSLLLAPTATAQIQELKLDLKQP